MVVVVVVVVVVVLAVLAAAAPDGQSLSRTRRCRELPEHLPAESLLLVETNESRTVSIAPAGALLVI